MLLDVFRGLPCFQLYFQSGKQKKMARSQVGTVRGLGDDYRGVASSQEVGDPRTFVPVPYKNRPFFAADTPDNAIYEYFVDTPHVRTRTTCKIETGTVFKRFSWLNVITLYSPCRIIHEPLARVPPEIDQLSNITNSAEPLIKYTYSRYAIFRAIYV